MARSFDPDSPGARRLAHQWRPAREVWERQDRGGYEFVRVAAS